jgi:riboflavin synthase
MFTGLIEEKGLVLAHHHKESCSQLIVSSGITKLQAGESIAVNGVCLALLVSDRCDGSLLFDLSAETLQRTSLSKLKAGEVVNLERAMLASARFGGHYVSGHVDTIANIESVEVKEDYLTVLISGFSEQERLYLIPKGSIAIDGVSLTINSVTDDRISLMLVPHTLQMTTLSLIKPGQTVNVEFDYLARLVAHQLQWTKKLNEEVTL